MVESWWFFFREMDEAPAESAVKLFDKWSLQEENVRCQDLSIHDYVGIRGKCMRYLPHTAGHSAAISSSFKLGKTFKCIDYWWVSLF